MFQTPDLYNSTNECQIRDSLITLVTYKHWLGDSSGQRILDVGSGSGNVTMEILLPRLSKHFISLVGLDKSEFMLKYATAHITDSRVSFVHLDIEEQNINKLKKSFKTEDIENGFDKIFSCYCLHWTYDNRLKRPTYRPETLFSGSGCTAFMLHCMIGLDLITRVDDLITLNLCYDRKSLANIIHLLRPGGKALFTIPIHAAIIDIWINMLTNNRWNLYFKNCENYLLKFPFHFSDNRLEDYKAVLEETGFEVADCRIIPSGFIVPESSEGLRDMMKAIDPLINLIPENLHSEYIDDVVNIVSQSTINRFGTLMLPHDTIMAAVTKPKY